MRKKPNLDKRRQNCVGIIPENPESLRGKWRETYGFDRICVEIGCGKGRFINGNAKKDPNTLFIGIEREPNVFVMAAEKVIADGLKNVLFMDIDAETICDIFGEGEVSGIFLNFSDPWPKKKQAKRRLTHGVFLEKYDRVLKDDGFIFFKTDNSSLFEFSLNSMAEYGLSLRNITFDLAASGIDNVVTEYESRFMELGQNIYRVEAYKSGEVAPKYVSESKK